MSGFGFGTRSGLHRLGTANAAPRIAISAFAISESAAPGSTVGARSVAGGNGPYAFSIAPSGDPDGKFSVGSANLNTAAPLDFEAKSFHEVTLEADNGADPVLSRSLLISVTNAFEQPDLGALSLPSTITPGSTIPITGATNGSSLAALVLPTSWHLDEAGQSLTIAINAPTGLQSWSFIETLSDSANSPRVSSGSALVEASVALASLNLSAASTSEDSVQGDTVGEIQNASFGSELTLVDDANDRFAISNGRLVRGPTEIDFESASTHHVTVREELAGASNSPRDTVLTIAITNEFEQPELGSLVLPAIVTRGEVVPIAGATAGSSITAASLPGGWTLDGANREILIAYDAPLDEQSWSLLETLSDSSNSPNVSTGSSIVEPITPPAFDPVAEGFVVFDSRDVSSDGPVSSWQSKDGLKEVSNSANAQLPTKNAGAISFDGSDDVLSDVIRGFGAPVSHDLDPVWAAHPDYDGVQVIPTGLTRAPDGSFWIANASIGRSDPLFLRFSNDFSAVLEVVDLGQVYGTGVIGTPQDIVYDTDDDSIWFTSTSVDQVRNLTPNAGATGGATANPSKSFNFPNPQGLAIDYANNQLIVLESEGSAANKSAGVMRNVDKSTGATIASGTLTGFPFWDLMHFDQDSRALFITSGYEYAGAGADTFVGVFTIDSTAFIEQIASVREPTATAIEGLEYHDGKLYLNNNSGFHGGVGSGLNETLEYEVGRVVGDRVTLVYAGSIGGSNTGTTALMSLGQPFGLSGDQGAGILPNVDANEMRFFVRNENGNHVSSIYNFDIWDEAFILIADWDLRTQTVDLRFNGVPATLNRTTGDGVLGQLTGFFTDRNRLDLGAFFEDAAIARHTSNDAFVFGYRVANAAQVQSSEEIEGWLAHEFNLTGSLPANHPYKTQAPGEGSFASTSVLASNWLTNQHRVGSETSNDPLAMAGVNFARPLSDTVGYIVPPSLLGMGGAFDYIVDPIHGSDSNEGSPSSPWASLTNIDQNLPASGGTKRKLVKQGVYDGADDQIGVLFDPTNITGATMEIVFEAGSIIDGTNYVSGDGIAFSGSTGDFSNTFCVYGNGLLIRNVLTPTGNGLGGNNGGTCYYHNIRCTNCVDGISVHGDQRARYYDVQADNCTKSAYAHIGTTDTEHYRCQFEGYDGAAAGIGTVISSVPSLFDDCVFIPGGSARSAGIGNGVARRCQFGALTARVELKEGTYEKCFVHASQDANRDITLTQCFGYVSFRHRNGGNVTMEDCVIAGPSENQSHFLYTNFNPGSGSPITLRRNVFLGSYTFMNGFDATRAAQLVSVGGEFTDNVLTDGKVVHPEVVSAGWPISGTLTDDPVSGSHNSLSMADYTADNGTAGFLVGEADERDAINPLWPEGSIASFGEDELPNIAGRGYVSSGQTTNLLTQAGKASTLPTQSVNLPAEPHTLSFIGTGTIALAGASSAGPLIGTGLDNPVSLSFTPSAGSVTFTVSGDVRFAGLVEGSVPEPIISTSANSLTIAATDLQKTLPVPLADEDMLIWVRAQSIEGLEQSLLAFGTGSSFRILMQFGDDGKARCFLHDGTFTELSGPLQAIAGGDVGTVLLRRLGGEWQSGLYHGQSVYWANPVTANVPATDILRVGSSEAVTNHAYAPIQAYAITPGTFATDQEVIDAIAEIAE